MSRTSQNVSENVSNLECGNCSQTADPGLLHNVCASCGGPLLVRYRQGGVPPLAEIRRRPQGQFRLPERLPLVAGASTPTLGEGGTPLLPAHRIGEGAMVKDESQNPTGSFKSRGMAVAIARNVELGAVNFTLPSNGNAGGAAAAYGALHGARVEVHVPDNTPQPLVDEIEAFGASALRVPGTIADAGGSSRQRATEDGWFSVATLAEPYRVEGKKMMGYELFWDLGRLPDVVLYPTGGGTGLVGMVKAFDEMEDIGWIGEERPRMVAVQVAGCAPIVKAFHEGADHAEPWANAVETSAFGLRVPSALGDRLMLAGLRRTGGTAVAVEEDDLMEATGRLARETGVLGSPEGGACLSAYERLCSEGWLDESETAVIFNTGAASKYAT